MSAMKASTGPPMTANQNQPERFFFSGAGVWLAKGVYCGAGAAAGVAVGDSGVGCSGVGWSDGENVMPLSLSGAVCKAGSCRQRAVCFAYDDGIA